MASTRSFSAALQALVPSPDDDDEAHLAAFRGIAGLLLNGVTLYIGGEPHRFTEIEIYRNSPAHPDTFTHADPMQEEFARWYFHRSGGTYKSGSYKGLDIAFGGPGAPAGILIRGIEAADGPLIDGPSVCVDRVLARAGHKTIQSLVAAFDRSADEAAGSPLYVALDDASRSAAIHESPRVGLTLKRGVVADRARFLARPYRFLSEPARIKKGRANLVVGLHRDRHAPPTIAQLTGSPIAQVNRTIAAYEAGKTHAPSEFTGDLTSEATIQLFGACDAFTP